MESLLHRFLRYIVVDTQSDELSETQPSTGKQLRLLEMLRDELKSMGVDAELDEFLAELISPSLREMFVTPKDIDDTISRLSFTISEGINLALSQR